MVLFSVLGYGLAWRLSRICLAGAQPEVVGDDYAARRENDTQKTGNDENFTVVMCWNLTTLEPSAPATASTTVLLRDLPDDPSNFSSDLSLQGAIPS